MEIIHENDEDNDFLDEYFLHLHIKNKLKRGYEYILKKITAKKVYVNNGMTRIRKRNSYTNKFLLKLKPISMKSFPKTFFYKKIV